MAITIKSLQDAQNKLMLDAKDILHSEDKSPEQRAAAKQMLADSEVLQSQIEDLRVIEKFEERQAAHAAEFKPSPRPAMNASGDVNSVDPEVRKNAVTAAFRTFARHGMSKLTPEQRDLLTTGTAGNLIPQQFLPEMFQAQKAYGPIATKVDTKITNNNGAPIKISVNNDTGNTLTLIGEGSAVAAVDPTFSSRILGVDMVNAGLVKISWQELDDSAFDLASWITTAFGTRYARGIEAAITLGKDGAGTTLPNSATGGLVGVATAGQTLGAGTLANGVGWTDLTALYAALDPAYLVDPNWVMNSSTRSYLIGLKDGFGRPYFQNDPSSSAPFTKILGYDIVFDQAIASMGASAVPILFGSLKDALLFRTDGAPEVVRLNERFADTLETGFFLYGRIGSISKNAGVSPLVKLTQGAS